MITVTAQFTILPGKEAEAEALIRDLAQAVSDKEPGCLIYSWHRSVKDPLQIMVFENWRDDAAVEEHRGQQHMKDFQSRFPGIFDTSTVKLTRWEKLAGVSR